MYLQKSGLAAVLFVRRFKLLLPLGGEGWDEGDAVTMLDVIVPVSRPLTLTLTSDGFCTVL